MVKTKLLSLIVAAMMSLPMMADSYREALMQYMQVSNGALDKKQYEQVLAPMAAGFSADQTDQVTAALAEYASTQLVSDMADLYEPSFRQYVTEDELKELTQIMSNPRFVEMQQRAVSVVSNLQQSPEFTAFVQQFSGAISAIVTGQSIPQDIDQPEGVTPEYLTAFNQFYADADVEKTLMKSFQTVSGMLIGTLRQQNVENPDQKVNELLSYVRRNIPNIMLAVVMKTMTLEDLQAINQETGKTAYRHMSKAMGEVAGDPLQLTVSMLGKVANWMDVNYPQYAEPVRQRVTQIEQMRQMMQTNPQ